ncbi:mechanosensitive ion channel [Deinococcus sp.]|uniref:mechanosensitive ion channel n=1 Tax=Deinococcus sp. TaxID=47478 RepID=UPI003CC65635
MNVFTDYYNRAVAYLPSIVTAVLLIIVALVVAAIVRSVVVNVLKRLRLDERLTHDPSKPAALVKPLGDLSYFLVILLFLPTILANLGVGTLLLPLTGLVSTVIAALPRLFGAVLILFIGLFVARLVRNLVTSFSTGLDRYGARLGLSGSTSLSALLGLVVYVLILLPVISATLGALGLPAVAQPVQNLIDRFLGAIPGVLSAALLIGVAYFVGRLVAELVSSLLTGIGFDRLPQALGLGTAPSASVKVGSAPATTPSKIVGTVVMVAIILFAAQAALNLLAFAALASLLAQLIVVAGKVLAGLVIFAIGIYLANLAAQLISSSAGAQSKLLSNVARVATLALFGAMALQQMGIALQIVNLAFGLTLGALAVAFALAFGLGGREAAGKVAEDWRQGLQKKD